MKCEGKDKLTSVFLGWCFSEATRFCCIALNKRISHVLEHGADPRSLVEPNMVLRECGQEPLQFFWFRASIRLFNSMLDSNSGTLRRVLKADLHLLLLIVLAGLLKPRMRSMDCKVVQCSNRKC